MVNLFLVDEWRYGHTPPNKKYFYSAVINIHISLLLTINRTIAAILFGFI